MRFSLDDEREALRATARDVLTALSPASVLRAAWAAVPDDAAWNALCDIGALVLLVPKSDGGLDLDETYLVAVIAEAGRVALAHPLTATAMVAAPLGITGSVVTTDLGAAVPNTAIDQSDPEPADPADRDAPGAVVPAATFADRDAPEAVVPATTFANRDAPGAVVPAATFAEAFLLASGRGLRLYQAEDVDLEPVETVDASRHCARVRPRAAGLCVTEDPEAVAAAFNRGVLGTAAELVGLSRTMLELTVDYAAQRHQFGKPIGSFQAVKHHLANARIQIEFAAPAVLYAAHAVAQGNDDATRSVSQAKWLASQAAAVTGRAALQCHGAIGYTTEHDLHLYLKRSWALARSWGSADFHADRVAASLQI